MIFTIVMCVLSEAIPFFMTLLGVMMLARPPRDSHSIFAYRTARSLKNRDTWYFAHKVCGKIWRCVGSSMFILSGLLLIPVVASGSDLLLSLVTILLCVVQCIVLLLTFLPIEGKIKATFHSDGRRR